MKPTKLDFNDIICLIAIIYISVGLYMIYPPLSFLGAGTCLLIISLLSAAARRRSGD